MCLGVGVERGKSSRGDRVSSGFPRFSSGGAFHDPMLGHLVSHTHGTGAHRGFAPALCATPHLLLTPPPPCSTPARSCPSDLPVCDMEGNRCLPAPGAPAALGAPWLTKQPATRTWPGLDAMWMRGKASKCRGQGKTSAATATTTTTPKMVISSQGVEAKENKQAVA